MELMHICIFFFIYAFLGWIVEVVFAVLKSGKFVNRGFLNGPVCPIYGFGVVLILLILEPLKNNILVLFVCSVLLTSLLEFITGFVLEKVFHNKWWDYSTMPFNIKGYICLLFSIIWGLACVGIVLIIHPLIEMIVLKMTQPLLIVLISIFAVTILVDLTVTVIQVNKLNNKLAFLSGKVADAIKNQSDEIGNVVSKTVIGVKNILTNAEKRILKAFPSLSSKKHSQALDELKNFLGKKKDQ